MYIRSFLKWPGGKYRLLKHIQLRLPLGKKLIEPFVGSGVVFLNTNYNNYVLNDTNRDLINLYRILQNNGQNFIKYCETFFNLKNNNKTQYYKLREKFNNSSNSEEKSAIFIYLNRHCYNGLVRYNNSGKFNVPFGYYKSPYFPLKEMEFFFEKSKIAIFHCEDFTKNMQRAKKNDVVYCDPPYVPLSKTSSFTSYQPEKFGIKRQEELAELARVLAGKNIPVLLSNHDLLITRNLYKNANIFKLNVRRQISCKANKRLLVKEILALYN